MKNFAEIELGSEAATYLLEHLKGGHSLARLLLTHTKFTSGSINLLWPTNERSPDVLDLKTGGKNF